MVDRMRDAAATLERYLVGGAVRDRLLGRSVGDRDWVVVGSTPDEMLTLGFKQVGADFPVFLHPDSHEEYALARTERKSGPGYHGFDVHAAPDVTLEDDLKRRDLTINAIAEDVDGKLIDPFNGCQDIDARMLRHVSDAFVEDPVRVLRVARFAARLHQAGFRVADDTRALMRELASSGELDALVAERVWAETRRALMEPNPSVYFEVLADCGALERLFPEIHALFGVPQPEAHHPEIDTGKHVMMALDLSASLDANERTRYAVLLHDLGKALTPEKDLPRHIAHEHRGLELVKNLSERLKVPKDCSELALLVCREHIKMHRLDELKPSTVVSLLETLSAYRENSYVEDFALACECDARGRLGLETRPYPQRQKLLDCVALTRPVNAARVLEKNPGLEGPAIGDAIRRARIDLIKKA